MEDTRDQEFVEYIVKMLVENPDAVKVERKIDERGVLLELTVDPADMGKVIGREGKTAKAVRTLLKVIGARNNAKLNLKIIEPEGSTHVSAADEGERESESAPEAPTAEPEVQEAAPEPEAAREEPAPAAAAAQRAKKEAEEIADLEI